MTFIPYVLFFFFKHMIMYCFFSFFINKRIDPFQFCPKLCPFSYNIGIDKNGPKWTNEKLSVTNFSTKKNFVTITLKMHDFFVLKVSGANGVLDIYRIQPVHNWIGNQDGWFSSQLVYFIRYDISSKYFRSKTTISNGIFSVE